MKIKFFAKEFELIKSNVDSSFGTQAAAYISWINFTIKFDTNSNIPPIALFIHELKHYYYRVFGGVLPVSEEEECTQAGFFVYQIIMENGIDIFERFQKWWDKNE